MLDCHCHIDLYPDPSAVAQRAQAAGVFTVIVTNLPSAYEKSRPHVAARRSLRLALGLHPLLAEQHSQERARFKTLIDDTSFIGEVGLDFSPEGRRTAEIQTESFEFVLASLGQKPKFISLHSRRAEARVLELLKAAHRTPAVFHWYSGSLKALDLALGEGHYFSVNPAMVASTSGQKVIRAIPKDRILTETDGPFVTIGNRKAEPTDIWRVEQALAEIWGVTPLEVRRIVADNFRTVLAPVRESGN